MSDTKDIPVIQTFAVHKMDCAAEKQLVINALEYIPHILSLDFDMGCRQVAVIHKARPADIEAALKSLELDSEQLGLELYLGNTATLVEGQVARDAAEAKTLRALLAINAGMFGVEIVAGVWAQSAGLIADSLDMLADASVYGVALYAVGRSASLKLTAARATGWLQLLLGLGVLIEVSRRFVYGSEPQSIIMMGIGLIALAANILCLYLLASKKDSGVHMTATWICSSNDVIANAGVIIAGALVLLTQSPYPDLIIGLIITAVVLNGSRRILGLQP